MQVIRPCPTIRNSMNALHISQLFRVCVCVCLSLDFDFNFSLYSPIVGNLIGQTVFDIAIQ